MTKYYHKGLLLLLFITFSLVTTCHREGPTDVTKQDTFTSGIEGPAVDHKGNLSCFVRDMNALKSHH